MRMRMGCNLKKIRKVYTMDRNIEINKSINLLLERYKLNGFYNLKEKKIVIFSSDYLYCLTKKFSDEKQLTPHLASLKELIKTLETSMKSSDFVFKQFEIDKKITKDFQNKIQLMQNEFESILLTDTW